MGYVQVPLHEVRLQSDLISGKLGVRKPLPVVGVDVILFRSNFWVPNLRLKSQSQMRSKVKEIN